MPVGVQMNDYSNGFPTRPPHPPTTQHGVRLRSNVYANNRWNERMSLLANKFAE